MNKRNSISLGFNGLENEDGVIDGFTTQIIQFMIKHSYSRKSILWGILLLMISCRQVDPKYHSTERFLENIENGRYDDAKSMFKESSVLDKESKDLYVKATKRLLSTYRIAPKREWQSEIPNQNLGIELITIPFYMKDSNRVAYYLKLYWTHYNGEFINFVETDKVGSLLK